MTLFDKARISGIMDVIRCDESSYLIWKWHPKGSLLGSNKRENAIRWGSSLRVRDGEAAVFIHRQKTDVTQEFILGPYDGILKTENLPIISNIVGVAYSGGTPFQAEVYFINLAQIVQVRFGVPFFDVYDPRFPDFGLPVAVRGTLTFHIENVSNFIQLHRMQNFSIEDFQCQIRDVVCRYVKDSVANAPAAHNIPAIQLEAKVAQINDAIEYDLKQRLIEDFGVCVSGFDIGAIEIDKSSDSYSQLMSITKSMTAETVRAQTAVNIKQMQDNQRIEAENYSETLRIQREEAQYAQHKRTQSSHFSAYQAEVQTQVGIAAAEALGKMNLGGANDVPMGGMSFSPVSMMAGMAVGGAVGQNLAGIINGIMSGPQTTVGNVPPPIPASVYHVVIDGQAMGPYDLSLLKQMVVSGQLTESSLVWKAGMIQWEKAGEVDDLRNLFVIDPSIPPDIPT